MMNLSSAFSNYEGYHVNKMGGHAQAQLPPASNNANYSNKMSHGHGAGSFAHASHIPK
jgi:hypothetical protein